MRNAGRCAVWTLMAGLAAVVVLTVPGTAAAQPPQGPQGPAPWVQFTMVHVAPSLAEEFVAVQRDISARMRRAGVPWRTVSRTDAFGETYRFIIATPLQNLAGLENPRAADPELAVLNARALKYITNQQTYALRTIPEVDNPLPANQAPALMLVNVVHVFPGKEQNYFEVIKTDFLPHFNKAEIRHMTGALAFGGESGYVHLYYVKDFAKLDEGSPVVKALGPAGAQAVNAKMSGVVASSEQWIARLLPDLSYGSWSPQQPSRP